MVQQELAQPSMYCRQCGYALFGLSENRCPECGRPFDPADPRTFFRHPYSGRVRRWIKRIVLALTAVVLLGAIFMGACFGWVYWQYHADWQAEHEAIVALRASAARTSDPSEDAFRLGSGPLYQLAAPWDYLRDRAQFVFVNGPPKSEVDLAHLAAFKYCTQVFLSNVGITDDQLRHMEGMAQLTGLYLAGNASITDEGLLHLRGLTSLTFLNLTDTSVSGAGLRHLQGMAGLTDLRLRNTRVQGGDLAQMKTLRSLDVLSLAGLPITDADLMHLKGLPLKLVDLSGTKITDAGLAEIGKMAGLQDLRVSGTSITDGGLQYLSGLTGLHALNLDNTAVTNAGLKHLERLPNLGDVSVQGTKVTPEGIRKLKETLPSVKVQGP